jgi:hypothetical protein
MILCMFLFLVIKNFERFEKFLVYFVNNFLGKINNASLFLYAHSACKIVCSRYKEGKKEKGGETERRAKGRERVS